MAITLNWNLRLLPGHLGLIISVRQQKEKFTVLTEAFILIILESRAVARRQEQKDVWQKTSEILSCVCPIHFTLKIFKST